MNRGDPGSRPRRRAAIVLLAALLPGPAAGGEAPLRYAPLPFVFSPPHRDLQWLTEAFALGVADRLEALGFDVASRRERVEVAEGAGLSSPSPVTLASRLKLARAVRAHRAVTGTLGFSEPAAEDLSAGQLVVTARLIDVDRATVVHERTISGTMNEIFSMIDEIALEVAWRDPSPPGPEAREIVTRISDPPLTGLESVMRALIERDPEKQAAALEAAMKPARDHPALARRLADCLIEAGRVKDGLDRLTAIDPSTQPDAWRLHLDTAEILLARGDLDRAAEAAARSLAARETASAHITLARLALGRGDWDRAAAEASLAEALDPGHPSLPGLRQQIAGSAQP